MTHPTQPLSTPRQRGVLLGAAAVSAVLAHTILGLALVHAGTAGQRAFAAQYAATQIADLGTLPTIIVIGRRMKA